MPRTNLGIPERVLELEKELREINGGAYYCTVGHVCKLIGVKKYETAYRLLGNVTRIDVPGSHFRYRVRDVARAIYNSEV